MRSALLLALALGLGACARGGPGRPELVVYAAASLRDALEELGPLAEEHLGVELVLGFGSSGDLARQIVATPAADVFFSADAREMERVATAGLVDAASQRTLLSNQLVVIEPADGRPSLFSEPFRPAELAQPALELLALAHPDAVPAGRYAREWLVARGVWDALEGRVLPAVDVRAALAAVESGAARAGIVYRTDAAASGRVRTVFAVPESEGPRIAYPVAAIAGRPAPERARACVAFLATPAARAVFERHGFVTLDRAQ
jgi:molybdate transport system substrate-binding protein